MSKTTNDGLTQSGTGCFLADCINGRAYATVLCLSSICNVLWVSGASYSKSYY